MQVEPSRTRGPPGRVWRRVLLRCSRVLHRMKMRKDRIPLFLRGKITGGNFCFPDKGKLTPEGKLPLKSPNCLG